MNRIAIKIAVLLVILVQPGYANPLVDAISDDYDYLDSLYKHFHANPELSFLEHQTAERLASELEKLGFEVTTGVGGTGVVAILKNGKGPTVLIRADMDALPIEEKTGLEYASTTRQVDLYGQEVPVMHACGHDMHVVSLIGTARHMVRQRDQWQGTLMLVGQPAEEIFGGAKAMMDDGLYERFGRPDYALALHVDVRQPAGKIIYKSGLTYSSSDSVDITVHGVGTHGASPHLGKDPIVIASQIVTALQTLVTREISPLEPGIVTVGSFHAGSKRNIISDEAVLNLTVRSNSEVTRNILLSGIKRIAENMGRVAGLPEDRLPTVTIVENSGPATYNDEKLTAQLDKAMRNEFSEEDIAPYIQTNMSAEDFPYFIQVKPAIPGFYFTVGGTREEDLDSEKEGGPVIADHHSAYFKIDPEFSIKAGVRAMTTAATALLSN